MKSVCIAGCGAAGRAHAKALLDHPEFRLEGVWEPDAARAAAFVEEFAGHSVRPRAHRSWREAAAGGYDCFVIASPTDQHVAMAKDVFDARASFLVCEKPLALDLAELRELKARAQEAATSMVVSFQRRFDASHRELASIARSGRLGPLRYFHAHVSKGLIHNGSHMIDLIDWFAGPVTAIRPGPTVHRQGSDWFGDFSVECAGGARGAVHCPEAMEFSLFELTLVHACGKATLADLGRTLFAQEARPSRDYPGFFDLEETARMPNTLMQAFRSLYDFLGRADAGELRELRESAFRTHEALLNVAASRA